jgi:DNA invertase Pin-like site-specific DNA recombinase
MKRAVIYVRVSSEKQADAISPVTQENDCAQYCANKGYSIVDTYRDIKAYRVGKKMVEPSGTRKDRPGYRKMLKDG